MTKQEKIAREFISYLNTVEVGNTYYTTLPDAHYSDMDAWENDEDLTEYVNVEDTRSFDFGEEYKEDTLIMVTVACRKGNDTPSYLNKMIDDVVRCIYLNKHAIQLKFNTPNNIYPTGRVDKRVERFNKAYGEATIYFAVPVKENAAWYMDAKEN